jgi:hypothetical protein
MLLVAEPAVHWKTTAVVVVVVDRKTTSRAASETVRPPALELALAAERKVLQAEEEEGKRKKSHVLAEEASAAGEAWTGSEATAVSAVAGLAPGEGKRTLGHTEDAVRTERAAVETACARRCSAWIPRPAAAVAAAAAPACAPRAGRIPEES